MRNAYTAVLKQDEDWWLGWIEEVPGVNCQEKTKVELLESLRETLKEAIEFNKHDALVATGCEKIREGGRHSYYSGLSNRVFFEFKRVAIQ